MANHARQSRFNPAYLASRYAGLLFVCLALGLCVGVAWRMLVQPTRYRAEADVFYSLSPESAAPYFDWESKTRSWNTLLSNQQDQDLLGSNLRFLVKLAVTAHGEPDTSRFNAELALFEPERKYSTVFFPDRIAGAGPSFTVTRRDLAANLDFQTLATIITDLDPPEGVDKWDFSFFSEEFSATMADSLIVKTGPDDKYFRVFYHLYNTLQPTRQMITPEEAWRVAVDEVADRLDREAQFAGSGGFGILARRELVREFVALPVLAANSLYHAFSWSRGDNDFRDQTLLWSWRWRDTVAVSATMRDAVSGALAAGMTLDLYPLSFPRDTMATRIPPLVVSTLLAYIAKREEPRTQPVPVRQPQPEPEPEQPPQPEPEQPENPEVTIVDVKPMEPMPEPPDLPSGTVVDVETERLRVETVFLAEARIRQVRIEREAAIRHLDALREREQTLAADLWSARDRADRLAERYEALEASIPPPDYPVSVEAARWRDEREIVRARLAELLLTCTEEHPFVRQARRELAAIEITLAELEPDEAVKRQREERENRVRTLRMEWETATTAAANLEERRRRTSGEIQNAARAVESLEQHLIELDRDLAKLRALPIITKQAGTPPPAQAALTAPAPVQPRPDEPPPASRPAPAVQPVQAAPAQSEPIAVLFATVPQRVPLFQTRPPWDAPITGALAGLALGLLLSLLREMTARRFATVGEATRMVHLRPLAVLPAFDGRTVRAAASGMKGELFGKKEGALVFIPAPVESSEPKPAARRGKVAPAKKRVSLSGWALGLFLLGCAALVYIAGMPSLTPNLFLPGDISLPPASAFDTLGNAKADAWGENP